MKFLEKELPEVQKKGEYISMTISIIGGLRDSLDHKADEGLALNLDRLYEYMNEENRTTMVSDDYHS